MLFCNQLEYAFLQPLILYVTFHEQQECVYDFPLLFLATGASADVPGLVFKQEWGSHECLKTILTHPLRHTWPKIVMGNHTHTPAVHGKSFHKGLTKRSLHQICVQICIFFNILGHTVQKDFRKYKKLKFLTPQNFF